MGEVIWGRNRRKASLNKRLALWRATELPTFLLAIIPARDSVETFKLYKTNSLPTNFLPCAKTSSNSLLVFKLFKPLIALSPGPDEP